MIKIQYKNKLNDEIYEMISVEFKKLAIKNDIKCNYNDFSFIAKDGEKIVGVITGHSYYDDVHVDDLVVLEEYRNQKIGSRLLKGVEDYFKRKEFENINLTTYGFQAYEFYKKCGYTLEFVRENKSNPKLNKYFFIKNF